MEQTQSQPLYWDKHRVPVNLTLILSLGIAVWGLYNFINGEPPLIFILGIGVAVYTWVTSPRIYMIYADSLYIVYGKPRVKVIHFSNIDVVEMGSLATPDRLRIRPIKGRRQILLARDPEAFFDQLEAALNAFRAAHPEYGITLESSRDMAAGIIDVEPVAVIPTDDPAHVPESSDPESISEYYGESATLEEGAGGNAGAGAVAPTLIPPMLPRSRRTKIPRTTRRPPRSTGPFTEEQAFHATRIPAHPEPVEGRGGSTSSP